MASELAHNSSRASAPTLGAIMLNSTETNALGAPLPQSAQLWRSNEATLREWLVAHRGRLLRWSRERDNLNECLRYAGPALRRLRGEVTSIDWMFAAAVMSARLTGPVPEGGLAGLPPELRCVLRLVAQDELRPEEALALLPQPMDQVRARLINARLQAPRH